MLSILELIDIYYLLSISIICYLLYFIYYLLYFIYDILSIIYYLLSIIYYLLSIIYYLLSIIHYIILSIIYYLLSTIYYLLLSTSLGLDNWLFESVLQQKSTNGRYHFFIIPTGKDVSSSKVIIGYHPYLSLAYIYLYPSCRI